MYTYKYIIVMDIDELILVPGWNIEAYADKHLSENYSHIAFRQAYTFLQSPVHHDPYLYKLNYRVRAPVLPPGINLKSILSPRKIITVHNHWPITCVGGCRAFDPHPDEARLLHYRFERYPGNVTIMENATRSINSVISKNVRKKYIEIFIKKTTKSF